MLFICDGTICRGNSSGVRMACLSMATITLYDARSTDDRTTVTAWGANDCRGRLLLPPPSTSPLNLKSSSAYTAGIRRTAKFRGVPGATSCIRHSRNSFLMRVLPHCVKGRLKTKQKKTIRSLSIVFLPGRPAVGGRERGLFDGNW